MLYYEDVFTTPDARMNMVKGLIRLAKADGTISQEERHFFMEVAQNFCISPDEIKQLEQWAESDANLDINFATDREKLLFIREGIQICAIDNSYDAAERATIRSMATALNIPESSIVRIEAWVNDGMAWMAQGDKLIQEQL